jgi:hypothetical protein
MVNLMMPGKLQCHKYEHGGFIYIKNMEDYYTYENFTALNMRLYTFDELKQNPGIYTYILICTKDDNNVVNYDFISMKSESPLEFNSKHGAMIQIYSVQNGLNIQNPRSEQAKQIVCYSGEMDVSQDRILFNFESGTYMLDKFKSLSSLQLVKYKNFIEIMKNTFGNTTPLEFTTEKSYVPSHVSQHEVDSYFRPLGAEIYLFTDETKCGILNRIERNNETLQCHKAMDEYILLKLFKNKKLTPQELKIKKEKYYNKKYGVGQQLHIVKSEYDEAVNMLTNIEQYGTRLNGGKRKTQKRARKYTKKTHKKNKKTHKKNKKYTKKTKKHKK